MERETEKGFTIMEIFIAAGIMSLLAALSVRPMKDYLRRVDFQNNSQNIKRLVQTAQSKAMGNPNVHIGVFLDRVSTPNRVMLFQDLGNPSAYNYDKNTDPPYLAPAILKPGILIKTIAPYTDDEIVFRGDGSAWKSMKVLLTNGTLKDTLDVLASTGRVRVKR